VRGRLRAAVGLGAGGRRLRRLEAKSTLLLQVDFCRLSFWGVRGLKIRMIPRFFGG